MPHKANEKGTLIGILDINGKEIKNGDRIKVQHVNYIDTPKEKIKEEFTARVFYHEFSATYKYSQLENSKDGGYIFNHRSSKFEVLED